MKKTIGILLLFAAIVLVACKKNNSGTASTCVIATVVYAGDPAADGLGWVLTVTDSSGTHQEKPENLAAVFQVNGLQVDVCYEPSAQLYACFCTQPMKMINIITIKKH
jgi:hypothetical protein